MGFAKVSGFPKAGVTNNDLTKAGFILAKDEDGNIKDPTEIAGINLEKFSMFFTKAYRLIYHKSDVFYRYTTVHAPIDDNMFSRILKAFLNRYTEYMWSETLDRKIKGECKVHFDRVEDFDTNKNILNLKSGLFDITTGEHTQHSPTHYSTIQLPIKFDPNADCPSFMKFLEQTFKGDEELVNFTAQMMGYLLTAETKAEKAFLLLGSGSNGKSTLIKVITALVGKANTCNVPITELGNSFARYSLLGKLVCACTENEKDGSNAVKSFGTGVFKALVSGDDVDIEIKNGARFSITPTVKFLFAFNTLPTTKDSTHGFFRKIVIIPFNNIVDEDMKNPELPEELKCELDGIFNFALRGLNELRKNKYKFPVPAAVKRELAKYKSTVNSLIDYVKDNIEVCPDSKVKNKDLYEDYCIWADGEDLLKKGREFIGRLKAALDNANIKYEDDKDEGFAALKGIALKNPLASDGAEPDETYSV